MERDGVGAGDRVAGFVANVPEAVVAMLAATSLGAIWSSCSPDFGVDAVVDRFGQIRPKVLFAADGYRYGGKPFDCATRLPQIVRRIDSIKHLVAAPMQCSDRHHEHALSLKASRPALPEDHCNLAPFVKARTVTLAADCHEGIRDAGPWSRRAHPQGSLAVHASQTSCPPSTVPVAYGTMN